MAQETTERATARRRAALTFGADAAVLAAAGFAALAALAGRGLAPGAAGMEALGALLPELGRQAAYPLLRALGGLCGSPWAANLLGAAVGALAPARLWGAGQDVLRRVRLDLGLPAEAAEAFLGAAGEARVAVAAPWLDPWLIWARLGEGRGPLPLSPLSLAGRGRDALLGELLAEPTLAGADPGRLRRMADAPWALFLEDLLAARPAFRQAAVFAGPGHLFFRARLIEAPGGLWARARAEDDPPPDLAAAEAALADFAERFGPRLRRAPDPGEPRVAQPFREALRRHLSRQHNALGAAWEDAGAPGRAFVAYRQALAWDAANTVALLNAHALALAGHAPDEAAAKAVDATFRAFAKQCLQRRGSPLSLDELIARYGPLRNYALAASLPGGFATDGLAESLYALLLRAEGSPSVRALLIRAGVHLRRGEAARAEACCREALELAPDSLPALRALARLRQAAGAPGEAPGALGARPGIRREAPAGRPRRLPGGARALGGGPRRRRGRAQGRAGRPSRARPPGPRRHPTGPGRPRARRDAPRPPGLALPRGLGARRARRGGGRPARGVASGPRGARPAPRLGRPAGARGGAGAAPGAVGRRRGRRPRAAAAGSRPARGVAGAGAGPSAHGGF